MTASTSKAIGPRNTVDTCIVLLTVNFLGHALFQSTVITKVVSPWKQHSGLDRESSPKAQALKTWCVVLCFWEVMETGVCVCVCVCVHLHMGRQGSLSCYSSGLIDFIFCNNGPRICQSSQAG